MSDNSAFMGGVVIGSLVAIGICITAILVSRSDITDTEFLRFCMKNDIPLERCKISGPILDKSQEAADGK